MMNAFWEAIDAQLDMLRSAKSADDVIRILGGKQVDVASGDAFFAGSGGDGSVEGALEQAGWTPTWRNAHYHWAMRAPDGSSIEYVEGDIYAKVGRPLPNGELKAARKRCEAARWPEQHPDDCLWCTHLAKEVRDANPGS